MNELVKSIIEIAVVVVIGIIGFFMRRELDRIKADNDDLRYMIKEREERNYDINKEQDAKLESLGNRMVVVETVQGHCATCQGKK